MQSVGAILKAAREYVGMSQEELAAKAKISKGTVWNIEKGATKPNGGTLAALARALGATTWEDVIARFSRSSRPDGFDDVPLLTDVPASFNGESHTFGGYGYEEPRQFMPRLPDPVEYRDDNRLFAVSIVGDSMEPLYREGDIIVCSPRAWEDHGFEDGRRYAIRFVEEAGGGTTVKRVRLIGDDQVDLIPENDRHPVRRVAHAEIKLAARVVARYVTE